MEHAGDTGELSLRYPVYTVLSPEGDGEEHLVVVEADGQDCLPLFRTKELAELYLEQAQGGDAGAELVLHACGSDAELEHLLTQLPRSVAQVVWDPTARARVLRMTAVRVLLALVRGEQG
ncbi:MAG TPA: hypothetical protein VJ739_05685 [Gemmataceae bacterium]|nr:hypothetical protein [Gemmataceae bacterium]